MFAAPQPFNIYHHDKDIKGGITRFIAVSCEGLQQMFDNPKVAILDVFETQILNVKWENGHLVDITERKFSVIYVDIE